MQLFEIWIKFCEVYCFVLHWWIFKTTIFAWKTIDCITYNGWTKKQILPNNISNTLFQQQDFKFIVMNLLRVYLFEMMNNILVVFIFVFLVLNCHHNLAPTELWISQGRVALTTCYCWGFSFSFQQSLHGQRLGMLSRSSSQFCYTGASLFVSCKQRVRRTQGCSYGGYRGGRAVVGLTGWRARRRWWGWEVRMSSRSGMTVNSGWTAGAHC